MLSVPSVVIPFERNFLLNPRHGLFASVSLKEDSAFLFRSENIRNRPKKP